MISALDGYYRVSTAARPSLRVGLLLDFRHQIPAYAARIIKDIQASNFAKVECLVVTRAAGISWPTPPLNSLFRHVSNSQFRKHLLFQLYLRLDQRMKPTNDPVANFDSRNLLSEIDTTEVELLGGSFPTETLEKIRAKDLDVILQFGCETLHGDILKTPRYGVWSYHHGDPEFYRGGPAHFWELREGSPLSGVVLQVLREDLEDGLVLCKSLFATARTLAVSRNRLIPYWGSTEMVLRKLKELHQFGWQNILERTVPSAPYKGKRAKYATPTNRDMLPWLGPMLLKKVLSPFRRRTVQHWRIANRVNGTPLYESGPEFGFSAFRWIDAPKGHYWADPFPFEHNDTFWVFFEDYSYNERRGSIACAEVSAQGELGPTLLCLERKNRHYSYPHVFRAGSEIFMIPESFDSNRVDLFRCRQFPDQWVREATLLEGKLVDTTIWEHEGVWWLATTSADPVPGAGCLLLFYSASLTGDWHFHPANPISTDIRQMRCAGRVIQTQNRLIRTSQSGAPDYGYSIAFHEITELSRDHYSEQTLKAITPEHWPGLTGIHTYNRAGSVEFIDGRCSVPLKRVRLPDRQVRP